MNHDNPLTGYSNRLASRRLHRRLGLSLASSCTVQANTFSASSIGANDLDVAVADHGQFGLLAAELRIAELEKALAEARDAACTDPLTGALNRRGFDKACQRELARARRSGTPLALAHIDLDNFKRLNDTFGHLVGDKALVHLVDVLHRSMRPSDVLCRFGGEEFILMLPETDLARAYAAMSRFLRDFSAQVVPGTRYTMTFSAGVVVPAPDESMEEAIARADAATYAAKHAGKNCVVAC
jgi:diguanylate cyclase (GGDEF)-like protein